MPACRGVARLLLDAANDLAAGRRIGFAGCFHAGTDALLEMLARGQCRFSSSPDSRDPTRRRCPDEKSSPVPDRALEDIDPLYPRASRIAWVSGQRVGRECSRPARLYEMLARGSSGESRGSAGISDYWMRINNP